VILLEKFEQHQPLSRQAERYACEGAQLALSTLVAQVGDRAATLMPLCKRPSRSTCSPPPIRHGDDTTGPVLAKGKTDTDRLRSYSATTRRSAAPITGGGADYSRDRRGGYPATHLVGCSGILQADAYGGCGDLHAGDRQPAPILEASC
jgi:hypothetical protein